MRVSEDEPKVLHGRRGSVYCQIPSITDTHEAKEQEERLRTQALARYFTAVQIKADTIGSRCAEPVPPTLSNNTHLTALTQLAALRLNSDRAFISLLDSDTQYIIAEATRSVSLRNINHHSIPQDALCLGVQALDKTFGVCPDTVDVFTDNLGINSKVSPNLICNSTRYVIRNMAELEAYKNKPYVTGFPHMRSYLEVPLKTSKGRVIGGLCVIDNNVRDEFKDDESVFVLNEIASSIMDYLELVTVRHNHDRGERLMEGLSLFAEGRESFTAHTTPGANEAPSSAAQPRKEKEPGAGSSFDLGESLESHQSEISSNNRHDDASPRSSFPSLDLSNDGQLVSDVDIQTDQQTPLTSPSSGTTFDASHEMSLITSKYSATFSRAANLIREAMDMEGLTFLDGDDFISDQSKSLRSSTTRGQSDAGGSIEEEEEPPIDEYSPLCTTLGCSSAPVEDKGGLTAPLALHQHTLRRMVNMYPRGCVFSIDRDGIVTSSVADGEQSTAKLAKKTKGPSPRSQKIPLELQSLLSATRTAIFLPLWDVRKGQFFAGLLGWTRDPTRVFEKEDLTCFSAFGDSLMTELGRLEAVEFSRAKSNFISSVSHELRSPLHGILAGAELLRDAIKDESQSEMVRIIETCGTTLLDTLNHLLDFAKLNNLDDPKVLVQKSVTPADQKPNLVDENPIQDLGELMQDVVEGVYFGYVSKAAAHQSPRATRNSSMTGTEQLGNTRGTFQRHPKHLEDTQVAVFVNVEQDTDWQIPLQVGAWKRVVMNTFSNALKYTRRGQVELSLKKIITTDPSNSTRRYASFTVKDTGIGMGQDYLKHQLFKPFAQEDPIADGTGLGLSIVKQIVDNLGGTIDVQSTIGVGTRIEVMVPIPPYPQSDSVARPVSPSMAEGAEKLQGRTICLVSFGDQPNPGEIPAHALNAEGQRLSTTTALLTQLASTHFGMKVISAQNLDVAADFYVAETSFIASNLDLKARRGKRVLSLGSEFFNKLGGLAIGGPVTHIKYPIGPRNLGKALLAANKTCLEDAKVISATNQETVAGMLPFHNNALNGGIVMSPPIIGHGSNDTSTKSILGSKKHLLLVDDNAINLKVLANYVKKLGCTSVTAENGLEAVTIYKLSERPFDVVFMDISMPVMNGFEASRCIREFERGNLAPDARATRIVALTGLGSEASRQEAVVSGIDEFRTKPVLLKDLKTLLSS